MASLRLSIILFGVCLSSFSWSWSQISLGGQLDLKRLNFGVITLIPKIKDANSIKQFLTICLMNVSFKIITKMLAVRLGKIANNIINVCQTAFIKGRNILDGVLSLHEILHDLKSNKKSGIVLKLDFEKAYDKVQWSFLHEIMIGKGFPEKWIDWVMSTVQGGKVSININGSVGPYFVTHRGLRQGAPSPHCSLTWWQML